MYRYLMLVVLSVCLTMFSYAQDNIDMVEMLNIKQDIVSLEKRISKLIKNNSEIANVKGVVKRESTEAHLER